MRRNSPLTAPQQRRSIVGGGTVIPIDTCHDLMVSEPERLAGILVDRCLLYSQ